MCGVGGSFLKPPIYYILEVSQRKETCGREWMEGLGIKRKGIMAAPIW